jgi:hypothetical protein
MSFRLSSFKYSNESSGINPLRAPTLSHIHSAAKIKTVARSLGLDWYHGFRFLAASEAELNLGDINPKVSIEMRRILTGRSNAAER